VTDGVDEGPCTVARRGRKGVDDLAGEGASDVKAREGAQLLEGHLVCERRLDPEGAYDEVRNRGAVGERGERAAESDGPRWLVEKALQGEATHHLGFEAGQQRPAGAANGRNGYTSKTLLTDQGEVTIDVPRDRQGTFEPQLVRKRERRVA